MQKIRLIISRDDAPQVLEDIQRLSSVEFRDHELDAFSFEEQTSFEYSYNASRLDFVVSFLARYENQGIMSKILEGSTVHTNEDEIFETARTFTADPIIKEAQQLEERLNTIEIKRKELHDEELLLSGWTDLTVDLDQQLQTEMTTTTLLRVPAGTIHDFELALAQADLDIHLEQAGEDAYRLTYLNEDAETVQEIFTTLSIETVSLPRRSGTPRDALRAINDERQELAREHSASTQRARELTEHLPQLRKLADYMHWKDEQVSLVHRHGKASPYVYVFEGWCPVRDLDQLYYTIDRSTHAFVLEHLETKEGEEPPVAIENPKSFRPFESVTRLYGVPGYRDLDPTLFLSGFFFIFFGLCLTDVGYGIFLSTVTGLIMLLYRVPDALKQLLKLLFLGGIASILVGLFFGGYFGVDIAHMPSVLRSFAYFDPINEPLPFFYLTLVVGFIQVAVGLILNIVRARKNKELKEGLLDNGPWLALFLGVALVIGGMVAVLPASPLYVWLIWAAVAALILTQGRHQKSLIGKGLKGLLSLYDSVGYFSDVLSYSRLLALGLATSALAFSINMIGALVNDIVPVLGPLLMVIVLIVGHTFNLVVNVLGAYIHTARLQFVEFFGKFITGSGQEFRPFQREQQHVTLTDE
ncbi:MAG: V-type ATPase 116kDa subunit family protein [Candidatus Paceibacterota bacterium]